MHFHITLQQHGRNNAKKTRDDLLYFQGLITVVNMLYESECYCNTASGCLLRFLGRKNASKIEDLTVEYI